MPHRAELRTARAAVLAAGARTDARRAVAATERLAILLAEAAAAVSLAAARAAAPPAGRVGGWPRPAADGRARGSNLTAADLSAGSSEPILGPGAPERAGFIIRNEGPEAALVAYAESCTPTHYTTLLLPGAEYPDATGYLGPVSGTTASGTAHLVVTELLTS